MLMMMLLSFETIARLYIGYPSFMTSTLILLYLASSNLNSFIHSIIHLHRHGRFTMPSEEAVVRRPSTSTTSGAGPGTSPDRRRVSSTSGKGSKGSTGR